MVRSLSWRLGRGGGGRGAYHEILVGLWTHWMLHFSSLEEGAEFRLLAGERWLQVREQAF